MTTKHINMSSLLTILAVLASGAYAQRGFGGKAVAPDGTPVGKQWLLVIGIDKYQDWRAWPELDCAVSDAKAVRDVLVRRYHIDQVVELYDHQATRKAIYSKLRFLGEQTQKDDGVLIYYAGHGQLDKFEGIGFWVPVDGTREPTTWLGSDRIKRLVANMKAKHVLLVSDSCFAGDFFRERTGIPRIDEAYYERAYARRSRQAMTSGGVEPVADAALKGRSPFAYWLLDALESNRQRYLVPNKLFDEIKVGVARNSDQTPRVGYLHGAQDAGGEFVFFLRQDAQAKVTTPDLSKWRREQEELKRLQAEAQQRKLIEAAKQAFAVAKQYDAADYVDSKRKAQKWSDYLREFAGSGHQASYARERLEHWRNCRPPRTAELPPGFDRAFMAPDSDRDQHGNAVVTRDGSKREPQTGWPYEIWLKEPRMELVLIPVGEFMMGSTISAEEVAKRLRGDVDKAKYYTDEHPRHRVRITKPFYLGKYETTNGQYRQFKSSHDSKDYEDNSLNGEKQPVVYVSWNDATEFCKWLGGQAGVEVSLPTEAQWEYACRAGTTGLWYWGEEQSPAGQYANVADRTAKKQWTDWEAFDTDDGYAVSAPVGRFKPNAWGLHDMLGNVWEWCLDGKREYSSSSETDPRGPESGSRALRGGSWYDGPAGVRSALRDDVDPARTNNNNGFRVLCVVPLGQ